MFDEFNNWVRNNVKCCACGGTIETNSCINVVELKKVATWKFPVAGHIDVPGYEPRAVAVVCDECILNKVEIQRCIEWEGSPYLVKYHDIDELEDAKEKESQMNYYFGKLYRQRMKLKASRQIHGN